MYKTNWTNSSLFDQSWKRFASECPESNQEDSCEEPMTPCTGYMKSHRQSGRYKVFHYLKEAYEDYCHFDFKGTLTLV